MGLLPTIRRSSRGHAPEDDYWYSPISGGTASGVEVDPNTALNASTVLACVRVLAETIAALPLITYRRFEDKGRPSKERALLHPLYKVLHDSPNSEMTSFSWRERMITHLLLWGNSYDKIVKLQTGQAVAFWPLDPAKMTIERKGNNLVYVYDRGGSAAAEYPADMILHIPAFTTNGVIGKSIITLARESIGMELATEQFGNKFFSNGATLGAVLEHPGKLTPEAVERLRESTKKYQGSNNARGTMILEEGMKWSQIGIPPEDGQFLETRKFQRSVIAGWFRVPAHLINDLGDASFNNITQMDIAFGKHGIMPWTVRIEQVLVKQLFRTGRYFPEFLLEGLLRGDPQSRGALYQTMWNVAAINANEIRARENMNAQPGDQGDTYWRPMNMVDASLTSEPAKLTPTESDDAADDDAEGLETNDEADGAEEGRSARRVPVKELRTPAERNRLRIAWEPIWLDAAQRLTRGEVREIIKLAEKHLRSTDGFLAATDDYYENSFPAYYTRSMRPVVSQYSAEIALVAAGESGAADVAMGDFIETYLASLRNQHAGSSLAQLRWLLKKKGGEGVLAEIEERMKEWTDKRPGKIASRKVIQTDGAIAREVWRRQGVETITWTTNGKNCPTCDKLHGKVIGINRSFVPKGMMVDPVAGVVPINDDERPAGQQAPIKAGANVLHPPLHGGCDCSIILG